MKKFKIKYYKTVTDQQHEKEWTEIETEVIEAGEFVIIGGMVIFKTSNRNICAFTRFISIKEEE